MGSVGNRATHNAFWFHDGCWRNGKLRDELLNREVFTTLEEAKVLIEKWRREYNQIRPHIVPGNIARQLLS
jgi:transposase InsO family protein